MKYTFGLWAALFLSVWMFGGFFIAGTALLLCIASNITTGNSVHEFSSSPSRKSLY